MICTILERWTNHRTLPSVKEESQIIGIQGLAENVFAAKRDIVESPPHTITFFIETEYVSSLIGPVGKTIQALIKTHEVKIIVIVKLRECESAIEILQSMIKGWKSTKYYVEKLTIPADLFGYVSWNHY